MLQILELLAIWQKQMIWFLAPTISTVIHSLHSVYQCEAGLVDFKFDYKCLQEYILFLHFGFSFVFRFCTDEKRT